MRKLTAFVFTALLLGACGSGKEELKEGEVSTLPLNSEKQKISYLLGAEQAQNLLQDPNFNKYIKLEILDGFEAGCKDEKVFNDECQKSIQALLGPNFDQFNKEYNKAASAGIGKFVGSTFRTSWQQAKSFGDLDMKYVKYGFELGMNKADTLISETAKTKIMTSFMEKVNKRVMSDVNRSEKIFFDVVKKKAGIKELTQGLYLETIKVGSGKSPIISDDVKAHYVLMNTKGDTLESSLAGPQIPVFNLSKVIPGWTIGIPNMKVGGKYKLYVPQGLAYGKNSPGPQIPPFSTLVFYVDLIDCGPMGTIK